MNPVILDTIFRIAVIILLANIVRPLFLKLRIPPVVGLIFLGVLLGPSLFHFAEKTPTIRWIAEIGVLFLIFSAGIETDIAKLKHESQKAFLPAMGGVLLPFAAGAVLSMLFGYGLITSLMVGTIFTATSISISLISLIEINKYNSIEGRCIVNSAIIDDIIGIVIISLIFSVSLNKGGAGLMMHKSVAISVLKIVLFFIVSYLTGKYVVINIFMNAEKLNLESTILPLSVAVIFIFAWFAEMLGLAAITGAFVVGLILGRTKYQETICRDITNVGKSFFIDIFFIGIGLGLNLKTLSFKPLYQVLFILLAVFSKFIGSFLGALLSRFDVIRSLRIGIGMVPRGEVALIISSMAFHRNLIDSDILSTTILLVIVTSVATPFLIKQSFELTRKKSFQLK